MVVLLASFGVPINDDWTVLGTFKHLSNGREFGVNCGTNQARPGGNQGLNNYGISGEIRETALWKQGPPLPSHGLNKRHVNRSLSASSLAPPAMWLDSARTNLIGPRYSRGCRIGRPPRSRYDPPAWTP
jgi:hypothetical protein